MPTKHDLENLLNGELAKLLTDAGIPAQAEVKQGKRRIDIVADVVGLRVVLEAETGFDKQTQAIKDADARFKQNLTTLAFAVCYASGATVDTLPSSNLQWLVRTPETAGKPAPAGEWSVGSVQQLAEAVRQAPNSVADADRAAQMLSDGLDTAVQGLSTPVRMALARKLDLPRGKPTAQDDGYFTAAKRGMLVVAMAMLFHHRVHEHLPPLRPAEYAGDWPPLTAAECASEPQGTPQRFGDAWAAIIKVDYKPVFETARVALFALPTTPDTALVIFQLAKTIEGIASSLHGMRHDLLGRVFHRVLDTARYDGSFYTSTAAATLLAALAIREEDCDWSDVDAVAKLRICDPACGTGTLLMAAADRIRALRTAGGQTDEDDEAALALCLVEDVLWGYDINLTATHMAASALGMLSPKTQFDKMRVYRTYLGVYGGVPYLGSLEFLEGQARLIDWPQLSLQVDDESGGQAPEQPPAMDLVIMNPPFTRSDIRHDQFSTEEEKALKQREKAIVDGQAYQDAARLFSSGGAFVALAEHLVKNDAATLAIVLPLVVPTSPGNAALRRFLAQNFHIETIVSSHDPERIFFSENTSIGEVLIVCRRWAGDDPKPATQVMNLAENPSTPIASLNLANQLAGGVTGKFTIQSVDSERIAQGNWNAVNFYSPWLVESYRRLTTGSVDGTPFVPMSKIAEVGPQGRRIHDAYERHDNPTKSGRRALWYLKTSVTQSMRGKTDVYLEPKADKISLANRYWNQRSRLMLPHRLWLPLTRVAAVMLDQPALGQQWAACRPHDKEDATAAALCAYLNSSLGLLSILGDRRNRKPSYPSFAVDTLRSMQVPDFAALGTDCRDALASTFTWLRDDLLLPLPQMNSDPVRKQLDDAVGQALGLDLEWVATIRRSLSEEPSVTNRRFVA